MFKSHSIIHDHASVTYRVDLYQGLGGFRFVWVCTHCRSCGANPSYFPDSDKVIAAAKRSTFLHQCVVSHLLGSKNDRSPVVAPTLGHTALPAATQPHSTA